VLKIEKEDLDDSLGELKQTHRKHKKEVDQQIIDYANDMLHNKKLD
jgi:hypothetical protein